MCKVYTQPVLSICVILFVFFSTTTIAKNTETSEAVQSPTKDIRVLIDISGSMKKTDPNNLRQPAIKLFVNLLPYDVISGVWTFGKWVNMLIPHGVTDSKWKVFAHEQANNINSTGLFTNIEEAMRRSTRGWKNYDEKYERTLIILSDGVVDISKDPKENSYSRKRILENILPRLSRAKVKIHTIALSSLSDKSLLRQLSSATGGIHETIETTNGLDKTFMRIFNVTAPRDELPLIDNKVKVDKSIKEITFLTFRKDKSSQTIIASPSGSKYNSATENKDLTWHSENRYDLVTIKSPETGTWKINADADPDNRVMVITDLRLVTNKIPSYILAKDKIGLHAHLESDKKIITRRDFLHFVKVSAKLLHIDKVKKHSIKLKDDGKRNDNYKKDGIFSASLKNFSALGVNTLEIVANGTTFKRKYIQQVNIVKYPIDTIISITPNNNISISVVPYQTMVDTSSLNIYATHTSNGLEEKEYDIPNNNIAEWAITLPTNNVLGEHTITIHVSGKNIRNEKINFSTEPYTIRVGENIIKSIEKNPIVPEEILNEPPITETISWVRVILSVFVFNLILAIFAFFTYKLWVKYKHKIITHPCEDLINA